MRINDGFWFLLFPPRILLEFSFYCFARRTDIIICFLCSLKEMTTSAFFTTTQTSFRSAHSSALLLGSTHLSSTEEVSTIGQIITTNHTLTATSTAIVTSMFFALNSKTDNIKQSLRSVECEIVFLLHQYFYRLNSFFENFLL